MINIIYRLCDNETDGNLRDIRPKWYNKIKCLQSFIDSVHYADGYVKSITFVHDGPSGPLLDYLKETSYKDNIIKINYKDNLQSLLTTLDIADQLDDDIYFVEDDYLHKLESVQKIAIAVKNLGLVNGYDHLDRYTRTDDAPYDLKIVFDTDTNLHWRTAESTCCTWAATKEVYEEIKSDVRSFGLWDRELFRHLHRKGIPLWTALPGLTSQIDRNMSPGVDWEEFNNRF